MNKLKKGLPMKVVIVLMLMMLSSAGIAQMTTSTISETDPYCGANGYVASVLGVDENDTCIAVDVQGTIPLNVSDWVLLELRAVDEGTDVTQTTMGTVVARQSAFLLKSGYVVDAAKYRGNISCPDEFDIDDTKCPLASFNFDDPDAVKGKDLYAVVRHLNHLDVISSNALSTTSTNRYVYDFTESEANGGSLAAKQVEIGGDTKHAIFVGDVNGDTNINAADYLEIIDSRNTASSESDINFDDEVNETDITDDKLRQNLGRTSQVP